MARGGEAGGCLVSAAVAAPRPGARSRTRRRRWPGARSFTLPERGLAKGEARTTHDAVGIDLPLLVVEHFPAHPGGHAQERVEGRGAAPVEGVPPNGGSRPEVGGVAPGEARERARGRRARPRAARPRPRGRRAGLRSGGRRGPCPRRGRRTAGRARARREPRRASRKRATPGSSSGRPPLRP